MLQGAQKTELPKYHLPNKEVGNWTEQKFFRGGSPNGQKNTW
jgi:hypothetical protein